MRIKHGGPSSLLEMRVDADLHNASPQPQIRRVSRFSPALQKAPFKSPSMAVGADTPSYEVPASCLGDDNCVA
jgi:hypothetical protein